MCGIAGVFSPSAVEDSESSKVREMVGRMVHRGPDSDGYFSDRHISMGMRRLSIVDLAGGSQPIFDESGDIVIICNGEIYNHKELRAKLAAKGHRFSSNSDVETVVHLYEEHGLDCLKHLRGMFALAIWDAKQRKLVLARDRIGEKPLYLCKDGRGRLWFASEIKSILVAMDQEGARLSPEGFNLFLTFQYIPEPETPIRGLTLLPAGHVLELTSEDIRTESRPYWNFMAVEANFDEPVEQVRSALSEGCRLMGTADVPVGVALSGGIDSSLVAALTARHYPGQVEAFSVGYPGRPGNDERDIASRLAKRLGIPFHEVELSTSEFVGAFPELVRGMDTPVGDIAAYGYYAVSRAARNAGVPVLLSGMGGDELFWGYEWVRDAVARNSRTLNSKGPLGRLFQILKRNRSGRMTFFEVHKTLRMGNQWSRQLMMEADTGGAVADDLWLRRASLRPSDHIDMEVMDLLIRTWLRSNCLTLCDRVSMAQSVEMRLPILDPELIELAGGLRNAGLGDWNRPHKWLLIEAVKEILPDEILHKKKQGFTPPVHEWYFGVVGQYSSLLTDGALIRAGLLDPKKLAAVLPKTDLEFQFKLTLLEVWARVVLEGQSCSELTEVDPMAAQ